MIDVSILNDYKQRIILLEGEQVAIGDYFYIIYHGRIDIYLGGETCWFGKPGGCSWTSGFFRRQGSIGI